MLRRNNGSLANGDKGRRRSRLGLYKRPKANGVRPDVIHNVSTPLVSKVRSMTWWRMAHAPPLACCPGDTSRAHGRGSHDVKQLGLLVLRRRRVLWDRLPCHVTRLMSLSIGRRLATKASTASPTRCPEATPSLWSTPTTPTRTCSRSVRPRPSGDTQGHRADEKEGLTQQRTGFLGPGWRPDPPGPGWRTDPLW